MRVIAAVWWLFTIALLAAYIANFTALLSSGSEQLPVQTFEDLVKQRKLEFGTLEGSSTFYYFKVQRIELCTYTQAVEPLSWDQVVSFLPIHPYTAYPHHCRLYPFSCNTSNNVIVVCCFVHLFFHLVSERKVCRDRYFYTVFSLKKVVLVFRGIVVCLEYKD